MKNKIYFISIIFVFFSSLLLCAEKDNLLISPGLLHKQWPAYWIEVPGEPHHSFGVYIFRKEFNLEKIPSSFIINVSADNRYKLYVNGELVSLGPARGDELHWRFETVDIDSYLFVGKNVIAVKVWNGGEMSPLAQISFRTGFILQGNSSTEEMVNTNSSWKCIKDKGYSQLKPEVIGYYAASSGEFVDMNKQIVGWKNLDYDDSNWLNSSQISHGNPKGIFTFDFGWMLIPSPIPPMEMKREQTLKVREAIGINIPREFLLGDSLIISANTAVTLLLDQTYLTDAYPTINFSKGNGAGISIKYAEALYSKGSEKSISNTNYYKSNRNDFMGKVFIGLEDSIISNGKTNQSFTSLWWRTYRYIQIIIQTKNDPLIIKDIYGTYTGYPFKNNAKFVTSNPTLKDILKIGWHTARLCAFETYMDCPYYEQLQYVGDTRIQALVSYYNSGDHRLARNAIDLIDDSRISAGITTSRYPSHSTQFIPPFSLWWIGMLHDYWMYTPDSEFVKSKLPGERQILSFFNRYQQKDGSLLNLPYWNFTDWVDDNGWDHGVPPIGKEGNSSILDFQLLFAYELASQMENQLGMKAYANQYDNKILQLKNTIQSKYWNNERMEFADTPEMKSFSQHANALAILTGLVSGKRALLLGKKILSDTTLTEATIYFKYYVNLALVQAGFGNDYLDWLNDWKNNLSYGMTTLGEISDPKYTRSDCHAWGASPNMEFYRTILGIDSYSPGFKRIKINPHLGKLKSAGGEIPNPYGSISASYILKQGIWSINIDLPRMTSGLLIWKEKKYKLKAGNNHFEITAGKQ